MRTLRSLLLVGTVVLALAGPTTAADKLTESPYYPLAVDNSWTYTVFSPDPKDTKVGKSHCTMKVTAHEMVGGTRCARIEMTVDGKVKCVEHLTVTDDGIYRYAINNISLDKPVCILRLPPKKGETWTINSKSGTEILSGKVTTGEAAEVKVPAATFKNVVTATSSEFKANGLEISFTYYFASGTGMVKQEFFVKSDPQLAGEKTVMELEKFEPAKK